MCYNGQNIWDMGWFGNRTYDLKLRDNNYDREVVDLAFYGDFEKTTSNEPVLIRYNDIYLTFNRQRDINLETKEYPDMLLIVREVPGQYHAHTNLERAMEVGSSPFHTSWTKTNPTNGKTSKENIYIEVCSYTAGDAVSPDRLTLAIGRQSGGCPHVSLADGRQSNRGNAVVTNQQRLECRMQWPWVEIANPYYPEDISYLLCDEEVKQNPSQYCEMTDGLSELPVWKICRLECPQTNCATQDNDEGVNEMALVTPSERNVRNSDVDECQNLYSEVKIEVQEGDNSPGGVITKSCEDFAVGFLQTRKHYCEKVDITTKLRVGDICKTQCPGNYCSNPVNRL
jgi:hypothetical protein